MHWDIIIKVWMEMWYVFTGSQSKQITLASSTHNVLIHTCLLLIMVLFALCCTDCFVWQNVWLLYSGQDILQCTVSFLSSILIYTDMVYFKYIYGINKYEKRYLLVVLNLCGDILWESQWNGSLVVRSLLDFVCESVASHAQITPI